MLNKHYKLAWICVFALAMTLLFWGLLQTTLGGKVEHDVARPFSFWVRAALGKDPRVHPAIKVLAYDDKSVARFESLDLQQKQWNQLLKALASRKPRAIIMDKIFSPLAGSENELQEFRKLLSGDTKIVLSSWVSEDPIKHQEQMWLDAPVFEIERYGKNSSASDYDWLPDKKYLAYGPSSKIFSSVKYVGHIMYDDQPSGMQKVFIRLQKQKVLPLIDLYLADRWAMDEGALYLDDQRVNLNSEGEIPVNFLSPERSWKNVFSLGYVYKRLEQKKELTLIEPGDVVLILPQMFTGNTDFKRSPFGLMPGGFVHYAFINSFLSQQWLREVGFEGLILLLAVSAGLCLTSIATGILSPLGLALGALIICAVGLLSFSYFGLVLCWLPAALAFFVTGVVVNAAKLWTLEVHAFKVRLALEGLVPEPVLKRLIKNPASVKSEPRECIVSVMFIDLVGFSTSSETMAPKEAFSDLRRWITEIAQIIHAHGGIIDKTLGDGILCCFGYHLDGTPYKENHADKSLECAGEIQRKLAAMCVEEGKNGRPLYPARIGINTGGAYVGNLGDKSLIEYTMIGHTVNLAKRLEDTCQPFQVLLGQGTMLALSAFREGSDLQKCQMTVKHHKDLMTAYEFNPFKSDEQLLAAAYRAHREFGKFIRCEDRITVPEWWNVFVVINHTEKAKIVDFSRSGFSLVSNVYFAKKVFLQIEISDECDSLKRECREKRLYSLIGEIRWGRPTEGGFLHGVRLTNLSELQKEEFQQVLANYCRIASESKVVNG